MGESVDCDIRNAIEVWKLIWKATGLNWVHGTDINVIRKHSNDTREYVLYESLLGTFQTNLTRKNGIYSPYI